MSTCSIVSDLQSAVSCGLCSGSPVNCGSLDPALCLIPDSANNDMRLFAVRYSPTGALDSLSTNKIEENIMNKIAQNQKLINAAYPGAEQITWPAMQRCGLKRDDALNLGFSPNWPFMGTTYMGKIWNVEKRGKAAPVPLVFDYFCSPDIFILICILIIVIGVLYYLIRRRSLHLAALTNIKH